MQASAQRVARRFLAAEERFDRPYQLGYYLRDHPELGWKKPKKQESRQDAYIKRIAGVWFTLSWYLGSDHINLGPSSMPKSIDYRNQAEWDAAYDRLFLTIPFRGQTLATLERKALELAKVYKELSGPPKKQDASGFRYWPKGTTQYVDDPLTGQAALKAWRKDAEDYILHDLTEAARYGRAFKTTHLALAVSTELGLEENLVEADRRFIGRAVRAILDKMAKQGKIIQLADGYWSIDTSV